MSRRAVAALAALLFSLSLATPGNAATQRASLTDIEDEVMCPVCGTLLELSESPQAERERAFIQRRIDQGQTKNQIEDELVNQYGSEVLGTPRASGFDLSAWVVPVLGILLVCAALGYAAWRRWGRPRPAAAAPAAMPPEDADRLERDISSYDL